MKSAFTMIELIFVIVILGILASIAVPKLGAVKTKAEATKAQTAFVTVVKDVANGYLMAGNALNKAAISDYSNTDPEIKINGEQCGKFKIDSNKLVFTTGPKSGTLSAECVDFLKDADKTDKGKWTASFFAESTALTDGFSKAGDYGFDLNNLRVNSLPEGHSGAKKTTESDKGGETSKEEKPAKTEEKGDDE